jgi:iron complex transport system substrate-binding protein
MRRMRAAFVVGLLALAVLVRPAQAQPSPIRLISINMCTDQLLLDLATPGQIMGLSPYARDAARSWASARVGALPLLSGTAEEIILMKPDRVLSGKFTRRATREFIAARNIPLEEFDVATTIAETRAQILRVAELVGAQAKGQTRTRELDAAVTRLTFVASRQQLRILPLSRRGWVAGGETLISDLLGKAGLINAADEVGLRSGGFLTLEAIVKLRPDALLITQQDDHAEDQGRAMLLHPAITALFPPERRIVIPESLTICGGPMLAEAANRLADQLAGLKPRRVAMPE